MSGFVDKNEPKTFARESLRAQMPVSKRYAYFDHAAVGPLPAPAANAIRNWVDQSLLQGDVCWPEWSAATGRLRFSASKLIHCEPSEIALIPNTTFGINIVSNGYRWSGEKEPTVWSYWKMSFPATCFHGWP